MATTIINPAPSNNSSTNNGLGFLIGAIILVVFAVLAFIYVMPLIRGLGGSGEVQVNVPKSIDVNVKQSK